MGALIPPLFHPLDGMMYMYETKSDENKSSNTLPAVTMNQPKRKRSDTPDDQGIWEFPVSSPSGEDFSSSCDHGDPRSDSTPARRHLLTCTWQTTFLQNGVYTPLSSSSTHELPLPIASLYGVLPTSTATNTEAAIPQEILALIPAALRFHAHSEIIFAMEDTAGLFTAEGTLLEMREQRVVNRAGGVIERAFQAWRGGIRSGEMQKKMEGERVKRTKRAERRGPLRSSVLSETEHGSVQDEEELAGDREIEDQVGHEHTAEVDDDSLDSLEIRN
ncbi:hypothetical protein L211DRAFT_893988 [Terfezia boudieri ATCC MYA-4762]|uniref:Uncharacterized protein n=1 Tax=Terfezia boudieri ATCC MYA-4762 TaxID=1051890 RepID=A0A3N4M0E1_9PEZI|nr:hypothetical protein L211DRAFT_893988 [Terfezia boudieri ATCC MYA-4762]